jgi:hypothetical protein
MKRAVRGGNITWCGYKLHKKTSEKNTKKNNFANTCTCNVHVLYHDDILKNSYLQFINIVYGKALINRDVAECLDSHLEHLGHQGLQAVTPPVGLRLGLTVTKSLAERWPITALEIT